MRDPLAAAPLSGRGLGTVAYSKNLKNSCCLAILHPASDKIMKKFLTFRHFGTGVATKFAYTNYQENVMKKALNS
jgi:hypothetical protein